MRSDGGDGGGGPGAGAGQDDQGAHAGAPEAEQGPLRRQLWPPNPTRRRRVRHRSAAHTGLRGSTAVLPSCCWRAPGLPHASAHAAVWVATATTHAPARRQRIKLACKVHDEYSAVQHVQAQAPAPAAPTAAAPGATSDLLCRRHKAAPLHLSRRRCFGAVSSRHLSTGAAWSLQGPCHSPLAPPSPAPAPPARRPARRDQSPAATWPSCWTRSQWRLSRRPPAPAQASGAHLGVGFRRSVGLVWVG